MRLLDVFNVYSMRISAGRATTNDELEDMLESGNPAIFTQGVGIFTQGVGIFTQVSVYLHRGAVYLHRGSVYYTGGRFTNYIGDRNTGSVYK